MKDGGARTDIDPCGRGSGGGHLVAAMKRKKVIEKREAKTATDCLVVASEATRNIRLLYNVDAYLL